MLLSIPALVCEKFGLDSSLPQAKEDQRYEFENNAKQN